MRQTNNHIIFQFNVCRCGVVQKMSLKHIYRIDCAQKHGKRKHTERVK